MDPDVLITDALGAALTRWRPGSELVLGESLQVLAEQWQREGDYSSLARLYESTGLIDLWLFEVQTYQDLEVCLRLVGSLVMGAHWYRLAGDADRAALAGRRAYGELRRLMPGEDLPPGPYPFYRKWTVWEMLGESAVCFDPELARQCFLTALDGYRTLPPFDEANDSYYHFPSDYHVEIDTYFLGEHRGQFYGRGVTRIEAKMRHWL